MDDIQAILLVIFTYFAPNSAAIGLVVYFAWKYQMNLSKHLQTGIDYIKDLTIFHKHENDVNKKMTVTATTTTTKTDKDDERKYYQ